MGGHGGLNILPQKRWNVYNFENREKVRKDEEAAAREEQLKREQSRRRDAEFRLEQLRRARGLPAAAGPGAGSGSGSGPPSPPSESRHINLFEGLEGFSSLTGSGPSAANGDKERTDWRRNSKREESSSRDSKRKREERPAVISPEDEKYRMGYGVAGKGVKAPWYLSRPALLEDEDEGSDRRDPDRGSGGGTRKKEAGGKKTIEELRAERLKREKKEKEREQAVLTSARRKRLQAPPKRVEWVYSSTMFLLCIACERSLTYERFTLLAESGLDHISKMAFDAVSPVVFAGDAIVETCIITWDYAILC